jgi:hypothetical protein
MPGKGSESYVVDELVPLQLPDRLLQKVEEQRAALVRDTTKRLVRILVGEVDDELRELVPWPVPLNRVLERLPADDGGKVAVGLGAVHLGLDAPLQVGGPALVEPKVLPGCVRHKVARPAVRDLVRDDVDVLPVLADDGRRREREDRILHACRVSVTPQGRVHSPP